MDVDGSTAQEALSGDPTLAEILRRLTAKYAPAKIYLFGSMARGEAGPHSDYDLLLLMDRLDRPGYRVAQEAHALIWGLGVSADILVWSKSEFERRAHLRASLPATVLREGELLYAA